MNVRPGRNLVLAMVGVGILSLIGLAAPAVGWSALGIGVGACVVLGIRDYRYLAGQFQRITVSRKLPTVAGRDLPFPSEWTLSIARNHDVTGQLRDEVPSVSSPRLTFHRFDLGGSGGELTMEQELRIPVRGRHEFGRVWLRLEGPARILEAQRAFDCPGSVKVLPEQFASRDELLKDAGAEMVLLDKITFSRQQGAGTEFESLAEYRQGDDPRRIDWRTSARTRRPVVRRYQVERHRDVMILVDCGRLMGAETDRGSKLDCAIDAAMILGRVALQSGDRCGLGLFDHQVRGYLPPISGASSMNALAECVYDAQVAWHESDFTPMFSTLQRRQAKRSLIVVLSDVVDSETSEQFRASMLRLQKRHVVLFAALRTPLLEQVVAERVDDLLDASRKTVTFRLLREREEALHSLRRGGVQVLDILPEQLTAPLINQFIDLRLKNVL